MCAKQISHRFIGWASAKRYATHPKVNDANITCCRVPAVGAFLPYVIGLGRVRSFDMMKSASGTSREPFDLDSPNFKWTSIPT